MAQAVPGGRTRPYTDTDPDTRRDDTRRVKETRRAFQTTEFFVMLAAIAAVIVVGYSDDDSLDAARIWTLVAVLASAYMVSRGIAKAGSRDSIIETRGDRYQ
jgi:hypothetical protein